ncbi:NADPH-dependent F420 reductase [Rhizobium terrae]|uniref:NADPH-dependent F420 reductase n=1 Tax=Rhizobium terrae TaxID=2171756 RepID=UPI000E3B99AA
MEIGIIGAGTVAQAFSKKAIGAGHQVVLSNSGAPEKLAGVIGRLGSGASAAPAAIAAEKPIVLLAVPWPKVEAALHGLPAWRGQVLIDATNALRDGTPTQGLVDFHDGSSSEHVAALAPGARVVKAMNTLFMGNFAAEARDGRFRRAVLVSGDDHDAKSTVADLFESFGFAPIDLGSLKVGGRIQAVGGPIAGHDFFLPWPAPRAFPLSVERPEG